MEISSERRKNSRQQHQARAPSTKNTCERTNARRSGPVQIHGLHTNQRRNIGKRVNDQTGVGASLLMSDLDVDGWSWKAYPELWKQKATWPLAVGTEKRFHATIDGECMLIDFMWKKNKFSRADWFKVFYLYRLGLLHCMHYIIYTGFATVRASQIQSYKQRMGSLP